MGSINFTNTVWATSAENAFNVICGKTEDLYGKRCCNGRINNCVIGEKAKAYEKYSDTNVKEAYEYVESINYGYTGVANYIDLGIVGYAVTSIKKKEAKYKAKYKLKYCVVELNSNKYKDSGCHYDTKADSDKKALELMYKHGKEFAVEKRYVNSVKSKNSSICTMFEFDRKLYKKKPAIKDMKNKKIEAIREYLFYGWAKR